MEGCQCSQYNDRTRGGQILCAKSLGRINFVLPVFSVELAAYRPSGTYKFEMAP